MRLKFIAVIALLGTTSIRTFCQTSDTEYFVTVNGNLYLPVKNADKGVYPVFGYDKKTNPHLLIGGLGAGISMFKPINEKFRFKGQANLSRHSYWNKPITVTNQTGQTLGSFSSSSFNYTLGLIVMAHYFITEKFSVGTGFGAQLLLVSMTLIPKVENNTLSTDHSASVDHYYRPIMPVLPVEVSYTMGKILLNARYEYGLINSYKHDLRFDKKDKYGLLTFEVGYRIR